MYWKIDCPSCLYPHDIKIEDINNKQEVFCTKCQQLIARAQIEYSEIKRRIKGRGYLAMTWHSVKCRLLDFKSRGNIVYTEEFAFIPVSNQSPCQSWLNLSLQFQPNQMIDKSWDDFIREILVPQIKEQRIGI